MVETTPSFAADGYVPFAESRAEDYVAAGHWAGDAFHDVLDRSAAETPEARAAVDHRRELTYADLAEETRRIAAYLAGELGLGQHDRVAFQLSNRVEFLQAFFACSRIGAIPVMLLSRHREAEARHITDLTDARAFVTLGGGANLRHDFVSMVDGFRGEADTLEHCLVVDDDGSAGEDWVRFEETYETDWTDEHGDALDDAEVNPCDPGVFLLSGGTTGMPKAIPRTHNDYVFQWRKMAETVGVDDDWVGFPSVPAAHNASLVCVLGPAIHAGASVAMEPVLKPENLLALIEEHGGSFSLPVPTQIIDLLEHPERDDYDLSSLEVLISGGQKVPPRAVRESVDLWDIGFCNIFGMAEGPLVCSRPEDDVEIQATTVGWPIADADEIRIVDQDREGEVPDGEPGELAVRGPGFFTGYFRNDEENGENFDDDGWFYTEDVLSRRPDDGRYEVHGRIKDTIIRGGENIYAPGVEDEMIEHPAVEQVAVLGMPDERLGERPMAYVQLTDDADGLTLEELSDFLDERGLAVFKHPERLEIVAELPRTEVGKIDKAELKERLEAQLAGDAD